MMEMRGRGASRGCGNAVAFPNKAGLHGGWGWHYWGGGIGIATTHVDSYTVGTLVVDLFDSRTKQLIWRGWASDALPDNPQKESKKLNKDIGKLFKNFPPK